MSLIYDDKNNRLISEINKPPIPLLPLIKGSDTKFNLIITEELLNKIKYLCQVFPTQEWSGVLFYNTKGSIENISGMELTAFDLYPLDLGSSIYTEFEHSKEYIGYISRHPELMDSHQGLVHSHNQMNTFFSIIDTATLQEMVPQYKNYLSLIVNNSGTYTAALAVLANINTTSSKEVRYTGFDFKEVNYKTLPEEANKQVVLKFDANIIKEGVKLEDAEFLESVKELENNPEKQSFKNRNFNMIFPTPNMGYFKNALAGSIGEPELATQTQMFKSEFDNPIINNLELVVTEFLCKLASLSYLYKIDSSKDLKTNLSLAINNTDHIEGEGVLIKYSTFVYDMIEPLLSFMDYDREEDSTIIEKSIELLEPIQKMGDDFYKELFESLQSYAITYLDPEEDIQEATLNNI